MLKIDAVGVDIEGSRILENVSLQVADGELVCLLGRNGAGKTTLLRTVMGYRRARSGTIELDGHDLRALKTWQIAQAGVGFSPEESEVYADLTVEENIELPTWTRRGGRSARERLDEAYAVFPGLDRYRSRRGNELSGGERKMVSIARALTLDPRILLLDEPFEGLSPAIIPQVSSGVAAVRAMGKSILFAESNLHHVPEDVDRLVVIERGAILFSGSLADARRDPSVMRVIAGEATPEVQPSIRALS